MHFSKTRVVGKDVRRYTTKKDTSLAEIKRAAAQHKAFMKQDAQRRGVEAQEIPVAPKIPGAPDEDDQK